MDKMKFWESHGEQHQDDKEQDLTTLLSKDQRADLTMLIGNATDAIKSRVDAVINATQIEDDSKLEQSVTEQANPNTDPSSVSSDEQEAARKAQEKREDQVSASSFKELGEALTRFIDQWRDSVILRVGEVVNAREAQEHNAGHSHAQQPHGSAQIPERTKRDQEVDETIHRLYPPIPTNLAALPKEKRMLILHSMVLLLLSLEHYAAYSRVLLLYLTTSLNLPHSILAEDEKKTAQGLLEAAKHMSADDEAHKRAEDNKTARRWKVGLASVAGAAVIGLTGGLAAPLLAAGVGSVMGGIGLGATAAAGYLGTLAGSSVLVGGLFGAYGARMTGQMVDAYAREVEDFAFLPVRGGRVKEGSDAENSSPADRRLRVAIGISGWLTDKEEVVTSWRVLGHHNAEIFALRYELDALLNLGNALTLMVTSYAWGYAKKEIIKRTIFASLTAALWPLGLLKVAKLVDNPFSVAKYRSDKAGEVLADALINKAQGERPVTLIGYSLGARVIYSCLMSLAERKAFGLVESAVLIGAPTPSTSSDWRAMRAVVAGRLVNVFSANDYILGFLYRTSSIQLGVAGLQRVEDVDTVENVDVSEMVSGHLRYRHLVGRILREIGFEDLEVGELAKEEEALKLLDKEEKAREVEADKPADADEELQKLENEAEKRKQKVMKPDAGQITH